MWLGDVGQIPSLPGPHFSLLCYGVLDGKILPALPAGPELCCLHQGFASVSVPGLGAESGEEVGSPPSTLSSPVNACPAYLHAGVEGPVHLGLDIHHLSNAGREKQEVSLPQGTEGRNGGPRYLQGLF